MPHRNARLTDLDDGITAIDTEFVRPLLDASHLIVSGDRCAFVDTGTNDSVALLLEALEHKGLDTGQVDYVFLTHVHLDHAGGAGRLMRHLPAASAVVHPRGAPHMIDPTKLVAGAQAVYGEKPFAEMYGRIEPIPAARMIVVEDGQEISLGGRSLRCLFTEGHARHHYCLADPASEGVFTGDSFGVSYRELDTANGEFIFPTTTPIHFDPVEAHRSIDRVMQENPRRLYLTHYSLVTDPPGLADDMHTRLDEFVAIAKRCAGAPDRTATIHRAMFEYLANELRGHGYHGDEERLHAILDMDIRLNTMGIEYWLDHSG